MRHITFILSAAVAAAMALNASAQTRKCTISGYIRDKATGETLIGAGVTAVHDGKVSGAVTNEFGYYTLTMASGNAELTYSYLGCGDIRMGMDLQRDTVINISLMQTSELDASTIVARKDAGAQSTYMGAIEIPQEMIRNMPVVFGEPDVIKTIQLMPGVQSGMEGFSGLYVRGGGADENLMMLDGTPLYNVSHLLGLLSVFTPEAVKKVTFYKGSFPARYGGRVSSIVDVRTNDGNATGFHGSVSAGLLSEKLHFEGPVVNSNTTFSLSARGMHTFLFDRIIKACGSPANYAFYDVNAKVSHRFSDSDRLFLGFYTGRDYFRYEDSGKNGTDGDGSSRQPRLEEDWNRLNLNWGNTLASARWNHIFSSRLFANTSVSWNTYRMNLTSKSGETVKSEDENYDKKYMYSYRSGIRDIGARMDFDYTPSPAHLIKFGAEYVRHRYSPKTERSRNISEDGISRKDTETGNDVSPDMRGSEISAYIEDDMSLGKHFIFNPGLHLSIFTVKGKTYFSPEPRASVRIPMGKGWAVKAAYSRMSQYVHQLTSGSLSLPSDLWVPITRDIRPVTSDLVSMGTYFTGLEGWEFSVECYWKHLDNVLEYKDGKMSFSSASGWEDNVEMGEGRSYGLEFYAQKTLGRTRGTASYTLSKSDRIFRDGTINDGRRFPFVYDRRHNICLSLNQKLGRRMDLSAVWTFSSGNWMTVATRSTVIVSPDGKEADMVDYISGRNNYRLPPSHRLDFSVDIHKKKRHGERIWNFGMYNAYGARNPNWVIMDSRETTDPSTGRKTYVPALSKRTFLLFLPSFSYTFKF